jgi:hypothetical protein
MAPVLSVFPVPIEALLAPVPALPESEEVAAMFVVCDDIGVCAATAAVRLQAGLAEGELCANAAPERATPIASEAEKTNRDILSSKDFASLSEDLLFVACRYPKPPGNFGLAVINGKVIRIGLTPQR